MDIKILVAEDDAVFRRLVCDILGKQNYETVEAADGQEALDLFFGDTAFDLVILDVMMPVYDGNEVLEEIRKRSDVPVLMLTALREERDEVAGLSGGADDYITKPFSMPILLARLEALLRKAKKDKETIRTLGCLEVDTAARKVRVAGVETRLNHKEFSLLMFFVRNPGIVLSRERILDVVWGYDFEGDWRTVDAHVKMLRKKLSSCGDYIRTVRGSGYALEVNDENHD